MELGDLEFKPEDFHGTDAKPIDARNGFPQAIAEIANRILREKLAKAPEVFGHYGNTEWHSHDKDPFNDTAYPRARLVCLEEIQGGIDWKAPTNPKGK